VGQTRKLEQIELERERHSTCRRRHRRHDGIAAPPGLKSLTIDRLCAGYGDTRCCGMIPHRCTRAKSSPDRLPRSREIDPLGAVSGLVETIRRAARATGDVELSSLDPIVSCGREWFRCRRGDGLFSSLTVEDNLRMGAYLRRDREV